MNSDLVRHMMNRVKMVLLIAMSAALATLFSTSIGSVKAATDTVNTWGNGKLYFLRISMIPICPRNIFAMTSRACKSTRATPSHWIHQVGRTGPAIGAILPI